MQILVIGQTGPVGDELAISAALRYIAETKPDRIVFVRSVSDGLLASLREVFAGPIGVHRCSDAAATSFGVDLLPEVSEFAPGWATALRKAEGGECVPWFALNAAKKAGISLVMGATQSLAFCSHNIVDRDGEVLNSVAGVEVGNLLQVRETRHSQGGFVVLDVDGGSVTPKLVLVNGGKCIEPGARRAA